MARRRSGQQATMTEMKTAKVASSRLSYSTSVVIRISKGGGHIALCFLLLIFLSCRVVAPSSSSAEPRRLSGVRTGDGDDGAVRHYPASSTTYLPPLVDVADPFSSENAEGNTSYRRHHLKRRRVQQEARDDATGQTPAEGECASTTAIITETILWLTLEGLTGPLDDETIALIEKEIVACVNAVSPCLFLTEVEVLRQWYDGPVVIDERRLERNGGIAAYLSEGGDVEMEEGEADARISGDGGAVRNLARRYFPSRLTFKLRNKGLCFDCTTKNFLEALDDGLRRGLLGADEEERSDPVEMENDNGNRYDNHPNREGGGQKGEWSRRVQEISDQDPFNPNSNPSITEAVFLETIASCLESTLLGSNWGLTASLSMISECLSKVSFYKSNPRCYWENEEFSLEGEA